MALSQPDDIIYTMTDHVSFQKFSCAHMYTEYTNSTQTVGRHLSCSPCHFGLSVIHYIFFLFSSHFCPFIFSPQHTNTVSHTNSDPCGFNVNVVVYYTLQPLPSTWLNEDDCIPFSCDALSSRLSHTHSFITPMRGVNASLPLPTPPLQILIPQFSPY